MRARVLPLVAVIPFAALDAPLPGPSAAPPCRLALELHVRTPRHWGAMDLRVFAGEVDRLWAPYGVTFCWPARGDRCDGVR